MRSVTLRVVHEASADFRLAAAEAWLVANPPATELLVIGPSLEAARELFLATVRKVGAAFGWRRTTLGLLAHDLTAVQLAVDGVVAVTGIGETAVVARVAHDLRAAGKLGRYEPVADTPGFVRALAATVAELRMAGFQATEVAPASTELAAVLEEMERRLEAERLADRASVFATAASLAAGPGARHPQLDLPTLLLDVPLRSRLELDLVAAVLGRSPDVLVTVPAGDQGTLAALEELASREAVKLEVEREAPAIQPEATRAAAGAVRSATALTRLQAHLFGDGPAENGSADESLSLFSAPGGNRECVEIARQITARAAAGVPFDRMAVFLRAPEEYAANLEEALARAGIPAHFERGVVRPDPAGRAFLALLRCLAEDYSARRFAEYLSLGEAPDATEDGTPPAAPPAGERWEPPEEEGRDARFVPAPEGQAEAAEAEGNTVVRDGKTVTTDGDTAPTHTDADATRAGAGIPDAPVVAGTLRAPRRWERLIVEAAVVGGLDRWRRRLDGLAEELRLELEAVRREEEGNPAAAAAIEGNLRDLRHLRAFALPLLEELQALPGSAPWAKWLDRLGALASRSIREPERVLSLLAELAPLGPVGPVGLEEVLRVLAPRLQELRVRPMERRFGQIFVAGTEDARGRSFDVVFAPGLAEGIFPPKIHEDPILLDRERRQLPGREPTLRLTQNRIAEERLALHLVTGAARRSLVLSYPRMDAARGRPRVPSFYALESLRAAEGRLPLFEELARRADAVTDARIGWPAPARSEDAIDEAEYDLAVLEALHEEKPPEGAARYLLTANLHLGRALRFRGNRWLVRGRWTEADGLVDPPPAAREALAKLPLNVRPISATALHAYAACPYRYFLSAVHRLEPRDEPRPLETLDPLQRGSLVHNIQFEALHAMRRDGLLPVRPSNLAEATARLDEALDRVADEYRDKLAPAIDRVWEDGIEAIRTDLRQWLRQVAEDRSGFAPWRFELSFGLPSRGLRDPESRAEPVELDGVLVRGSIDLVERREDGTLRVTDHKTGKDRTNERAVVQGGEQVQPVLYALAAEKLFPRSPVLSGRLHYCTGAGGFAAHEVPLDDRARTSMKRIFAIVDDELEHGFLPALPREGACKYCDYLPVCGPAEEVRTPRKRDLARVESVFELREMA